MYIWCYLGFSSKHYYDKATPQHDLEPLLGLRLGICVYYNLAALLHLQNSNSLHSNANFDLQSQLSTNGLNHLHNNHLIFYFGAVIFINLSEMS